MRIHQVDSFTAEPFKGNPAGVCVVDAFPDPAVMSAIAMEMNLSETAFVEKRADGFGIRFFTPAQEVALCGHATLASAHVLRELGLAGDGDGVVFHALRDDLSVAYDGEWIRMLFPAYEVKAIPPPPAIAEAVGTIPTEVYASGNAWLVARVENERDVLGAVPDFEAIRRNAIADMIALTAPSDSPGYDFVVRVFCNPAIGITEDPATGAACCILVPYWRRKTGKTRFTLKQLSRRTGELWAKLVGDMVEISGQATTVCTIDMRTPS